MVCPECGTKTGEGSGHCPSCGKEVIPGSGFCGNCGAAFADNGVKTIPVQTAAPAPKASKSDFNIGDYFKEFGNNFTGIFKEPGFPGVIFEYGPCFTSVLILLMSLLPCYFYVGEYVGFRTLNVFQHTWLAGMFLILAVLFSVRRFLPHVFSFVNSSATVSKIVSFIVPGLHVIALIILLIQTISDLIKLGIFIFPFVFGAFIFLIIVAEIIVTVVNLVKKNKAGK